MNQYQKGVSQGATRIDTYQKAVLQSVTSTERSITRCNKEYNIRSITKGVSVHFDHQACLHRRHIMGSVVARCLTWLRGPLSETRTRTRTRTRTTATNQPTGRASTPFYVGSAEVGYCLPFIVFLQALSYNTGISGVF